MAIQFSCRKKTFPAFFTEDRWHWKLPLIKSSLSPDLLPFDLKRSLRILHELHWHFLRSLHIVIKRAHQHLLRGFVKRSLSSLFQIRWLIIDWENRFVKKLRAIGLYWYSGMEAVSWLLCNISKFAIFELLWLKHIPLFSSYLIGVPAVCSRFKQIYFVLVPVFRCLVKESSYCLLQTLL